MKRSPASSSLQQLGAKLAELQDTRLRDDDSLERAREGFLTGERLSREGASKKSAPRSRGNARVDVQRWALAAAALVAFCATAYAIVVRPPSPAKALAFEVGHTTTALSEGDWLAAPKTEELPVHFSDGTELRLAAASRARIVDVGSLGARVVLERGATHAHVVHRKSTKWYFAAGPFEVHVTGTQFQVGWQPAEGVFTLDLEEGSVAVTGCGLGGDRTVRGGQSLRLVCDEEHMVATETPTAKREAPGSSAPAATGAEPGAEPVPAPSAAPSTPQTTHATAHAPTPVSRDNFAKAGLAKEDPAKEDPAADAGITEPKAPQAPPPPGWRLLFGADRFHEAYAAASREGWSHLCDERDVSDLSALADMARFTGHFDEAEQALRAIRRRFPEEERAAWAAFQLGRLSFDQRGKASEAAVWFDTAYRERPSGAIAREALGRLMEARERLGALDAAREAARTYMTKYPSGPHAERARDLIQRR